MGKWKEEKPEIKALVFDMDGLLFDSERIVQRSWNMAGTELGIGEVGNHIYHTLGMNLKNRTEYFDAAYGKGFPHKEFQEKTRIYFRQLADAHGVPLMPGVIELLTYAKDKGYKLAVATSSRQEYSERLLKEGGIYPYFDGFVYGDMVVNAKPNPEIYQKACATIGAEPGSAIAIEDSPGGIRAAHAAGMYPVMIPDLVTPTEEIKALAWKILTSLERMPEFLETL